MEDITNHKFGELTAICFDHTRKGHTYWKFKCSCGNEIVADKWNVKSGHSKHCKKCADKINGIIKRKERFFEKRLYSIFYSMKYRCYNKNSGSYKYYGQRGITICDEWKNDFKSFCEWAIKNGYDKNAKRGECTIDRIDVNRNYCPENCRWVSVKEQSRNKRSNIIINGLCVADYFENNISKKTIYNRIRKGWDKKEAIIDKDKRFKYFVYNNGEKIPLTEVAKKLNINKKTIYTRIYRGVNMENILKNEKD